jgi:hypothetical protein
MEGKCYNMSDNGTLQFYSSFINSNTFHATSHTLQTLQKNFTEGLQAGTC